LGDIRTLTAHSFSPASSPRPCERAPARVTATFLRCTDQVLLETSNQQSGHCEAVLLLRLRADDETACEYVARWSSQYRSLLDSRTLSSVPCTPDQNQTVAPTFVPAHRDLPMRVATPVWQYYIPAGHARWIISRTARVRVGYREQMGGQAEEEKAGQRGRPAPPSEALWSGET
jgi:hypothetical protein